MFTYVLFGLFLDVAVTVTIATEEDTVGANPGIQR